MVNTFFMSSSTTKCDRSEKEKKRGVSSTAEALSKRLDPAVTSKGKKIQVISPQGV